MSAALGGREGPSLAKQAFVCHGGAVMRKRSYEQTGDGREDGDHVDSHLMACRSRMPHSFSFQLRMPWERRIHSPAEAFVKTVQMPQPLRDAPSRYGTEAEEVTEDSAERLAGSAFRTAGLKALKLCDEKLWDERLSADRKAGIRKWVSIMLERPDAWELCRKHFLQGQLIYACGGVEESVRDSLHGKASNTIHIRANPLFRYMKFCKDHGYVAWPIFERHAYDFLKSSDSFAATFPGSFLRSVAFAHHVMGLHGEVSAILSGRTKGVSTQWFLKKKALNQRAPLSVAQLVKLEETVMDSKVNVEDRVAAGFFAFMVYSRSRYSDALSVSEISLDVVGEGSDAYGFVEASATRVKTGTTLEKKTRFLPMAGTVRGVSGLPWALTWMQLREASKVPVGLGRPLLPAPLEKGGWSTSPLTASAAGQWMKALVAGCDGPTPNRLGTHSLKVTLLNWSAKYGLEPSDRKLLGYHVGSEKSMLTYSRDAMSGPLRSLQKVIDAVRKGDFAPDSTRSGYFKNFDGHVSSESSADEEDHEHEATEEAVDHLAGEWQQYRQNPWDAEGLEFFRHHTSRCIHAVADECGGEFMCGRQISEAYGRLDRKPSFMHPVCYMCDRVARANRVRAA